AGPQGPQGRAGGAINATQIATLRWYAVTQAVLRIGMPAAPTATLFDGANLWVGLADGHLLKVRPSDGATLATYESGLSQPTSLAFDGMSIWASSGPFIVRLRVTDGGYLCSNYLGGAPVSALATDGAHVWGLTAYNSLYLVNFNCTAVGIHTQGQPRGL